MADFCIAEVFPKVLAEREDEFRVGFYLPEKDTEPEVMIGYGIYETYDKDANCEVHIQGIPRVRLLGMLGVEKPELYRYLRKEAQRLFKRARVNHTADGSAEA